MHHPSICIARTACHRRRGQPTAMWRGPRARCHPEKALGISAELQARRKFEASCSQCCLHRHIQSVSRRQTVPPHTHTASCLEAPMNENSSEIRSKEPAYLWVVDELESNANEKSSQKPPVLQPIVWNLCAVLGHRWGALCSTMSWVSSAHQRTTPELTTGHNDSLHDKMHFERASQLHGQKPLSWCNQNIRNSQGVRLWT